MGAFGGASPASPPVTLKQNRPATRKEHTMNQRFSKRTRLVSMLLALAMVFTFLPFSAFAATVQEIEVLAFTTHGCDALQITEGGSV